MEKSTNKKNSLNLNRIKKGIHLYIVNKNKLFIHIGECFQLFYYVIRVLLVIINIIRMLFSLIIGLSTMKMSE